MKLQIPGRTIAAMSWAAAALMLCALPASAQDEDSEASAAQQGGHYQARPAEAQSESEEAEAPAPEPQQRPAAPRVVRPVFRAARPGGIRAESNQDAPPPASDEGQSFGGRGLSQGARDASPGSGSAGSGGGSAGGQAARPSMSCEIKDLDVPHHAPGPNDTSLGTYAGQNLRWIIPRKGCIAIKFTTGKAGGYDFAMDDDPIAPLATAFTNISMKAGDFDYANMDKKNGCSGSATHGVFNIGVIGTPRGCRNAWCCRVSPGQTYYINIRNEQADLGVGSVRGQDSCDFTMANRSDASPRGCGGVFQFHAWDEVPLTKKKP